MTLIWPSAFFQIGEFLRTLEISGSGEVNNKEGTPERQIIHINLKSVMFMLVSEVVYWECKRKNTPNMHFCLWVGILCYTTTWCILFHTELTPVL